MNIILIEKPLIVFRWNFRKRSFSFFFIIILYSLISTVNATVYYVSNSGDDSSAGTSIGKPWKTLSKVNNTYFQPGDQILFKRGDKWSGTITVNAPGISGRPIIYGAYGEGEKPKIYGSEKITGWTEHTGNIYKATFNGNINQLFVEDEKMKAARHPNSGYVFINSTDGFTSLTANDLDGTLDYKGAKIFCRTHYYTADLIDVLRSEGNRLTLNRAPRHSLRQGLGFFLMNKLEFLDQAGEWYYDAASKTVYLWTPNGDCPSNYSIYASVHRDGIYLNTANFVTVSDIHFLYQSDSGIRLRNSNDVVIDRNDVSFVNGFGIYCETSAIRVTITKNKITGVNHYGMYLRTSHSLIEDNKVSKVALFDNLGLTGTGEDNFGGGIYVAGENGNNKIRYNRVTETGYNGILFARPNNIIEYNFVKDACLLKSDNGGIYTSWYNRTTPVGPEGSIVRNNIVLNVLGEKYGYISTRNIGEGIYIDESAKGVTVENNTIAHCTNAGIKLHKNENTTVRNNTILDARQSIHVLHSSGTIKNKINNNLMMAASDKDDFLARQVLIYESERLAESDYNIYVNPYADDGIFRSGSTYLCFDGWKSATGQEQNSTINVTPLAEGETEVLFYNDTKNDKTIELDSETVFKDVLGNEVTEPFVLEPFTSKILIGSGSLSEYVTICEGEDYQGWHEPGTYQGVIRENKLVGTEGSNLIANGDFSSGTASWSVWGASGYSLTMTAENNDYVSAPGSIKLNCVSTGSSISQLQFTSSVNFSLEAGREYELSFYAKGTTEFEIKKFVAIQRSSPYTHYGTFENVIPKVGKEWEEFKIKLSATHTADDVSFRVYMGNGLPKGHSVYFDDFVLKAVSEDTVITQQFITTHLTITPIEYTTEEIEINEGESYKGWSVPGEYSRTLQSSAGCDSVVTTILNVKKLTYSAGEIGEGDDFILFPNPAKKNVTVKYKWFPEDTLMEIMDANGRIVFQQKAVSSLNRIDLDRFLPGIYYLRSTGKKFQQIAKLIIE